MSLEQAISENTAAIKQLVAVLQSGALPGATQPETSAGGAKAAGRGKKSDAPSAAPTVATSATSPLGVVDGDPAGTRYFVIEAHRTVYAQRPGEPDCTVAGAVITSAADYLAKKAEYAVNLPTGAAGAPTASSAAAPAPATPSVSTASSSAPATSAPAAAVLDGHAIVARCQALHKVQGNEGLKKVLDMFKCTNVPGLAAKTPQYSEIVAFIDSLLNPQPAAANLFG